MLSSWRIKCALGAVGILFSIILPVVAHAQGTTAQVGVFEPVQVAPGKVVQVPVIIKEVQDLYGFDVKIEFDPAIIQVEDADPTKPNVQVSLGDFLDPGLLLYNIADNKIGTIRFTMSQYNPSEAKTGEGMLFVVRFRGIAEGESQLKISFVQLSNKDGIEIPANEVDSRISVISGVPVQDATLPLIEATAIIMVASETPMPTATTLPTSTATMPVDTQTPVTQPTSISVTPGNTASNEDIKTNDDNLKIENSWWLILIIVLILLISGIYLWVKRNLRKEKKDE